MIVKIIGNGAWGTALYSVLKTNSSSVSFWDRRESLENADVVVLALPSQSIRSALKSARLTKKSVIIVNTSKGIERTTHKLPFQIVQELLGKQVDYFSLIGPSFASEVKAKMPTLVNLGYLNEKNKDIVKKLFQTDHFRIRLVLGVEVLELAGAFKNLYAIVCGIADGLGFGINTRTKLITLALEEFGMFCRKLNLEIHPHATPATVGDLVLTCNSVESRNFSFGRMVIDNSLKTSLKKINGSVEGISTADSVSYFTNRYNIKLPLATFIKDAITKNSRSNTEKCFRNFMQRA